MSDKGQNKSKKNKTKNCNENPKKKCEDNLGLASMSYADYIILASTLAYTLFEEMNRDDLIMIINFMYLLTTDLQALIAQDAIVQKNCGKTSLDEEETDLETEQDTEQGIEDIDISLNRRHKGRKRNSSNSTKRRKKSSKKLIRD